MPMIRKGGQSQRNTRRAERVTVTYNADGTATATDANGTSTTSSFKTQFGMVKPVAVDNKGCACGSSAYTYNANGFLASRKDFNGNLTTYLRDNRGLELSRTEASGTLQARTITTTWHPTFGCRQVSPNPIALPLSGMTQRAICYKKR